MHILIWLYDLFSLLDPVFNFAIYVKHVCFFSFPTLSSTKDLIRNRKERGDSTSWWGIIHIEWSERVIWGAKFYFDFKSLSKNPIYLAGRVWLTYSSCWFLKKLWQRSLGRIIDYKKNIHLLVIEVSRFSYSGHQPDSGKELEEIHRLWKSDISIAEVSCPWSDWADWNIEFTVFRSMNPSYFEIGGAYVDTIFCQIWCSLDREVIGCWCTWMEYQRGGRLYIDSCRWICASMRSSHVKAGAES